MILIVGCGYLGSYLLREILKSTKETVAITSRKPASCDVPSVRSFYCDVTDIESIKSLYEQCRDERLTVFYLAACHNVDYVYENPEEARRVNVQGLKNFTEVFKNIDKLFFASTDCVYGEGKYSDIKFTEISPLNPINEYGRQKIEAENIILDAGYNVLRFPFMLGPSLSDKPHFYDRIHSALVGDEPMELIDGMKRSTVSYSQAAEYMLSLSRKEKLPQIVNICADDVLSKYEIGCILAEKAGYGTEKLKKITESEGQRFFKEKRARYVAMDNTLLKSLLGIEKIQWEQ